MAGKTALSDLTLWGDEAQNCNLELGKAYVLKAAKVGHYQGGANHSVCLAESLNDVPQNDSTLATLDDQAKQAINSGSVLTNVSKPERSGGAGNTYKPTVRRYFDDITRLNLGAQDPKGDYCDVRCIPTFIKTETLWYEACKECNTKV